MSFTGKMAQTLTEPEAARYWLFCNAPQAISKMI
jgi:hypothetical protein